MSEKVLFLGQLPPPYHGQSIMIENLVQQKSIKEKIIFLNLSRSKDINEVSKFSVAKVLHLFSLIVSTFQILKNEDVKAIYYPPSGDKIVPFIRDIMMLSFLRMSDKKIIFHFHSMGYEESYNKAGFIRRFIMKKIYGDIYLSICLSKSNIDEIKFFEPKNTKIIPYGIKDEFETRFNKDMSIDSLEEDKPVRILYLGNIYKSKGVSILMDAAYELIEQGYSFEINFVGGIKNSSFKKEIENHPAYNKGFLNFLGVKTGNEKWNQLNNADIFCFPTFYENENFPVVLIEAMQFGLPIISTRWRSIPEMVEEDENGILVDPMNRSDLIISMKNLIEDSALRKKMGKKSRRRYLKYYTLDNYVDSFKKVFSEI